MPSKGDPKKSVENGKDGDGPVFENAGNESDSFGPVLRRDGGNGIVPPASSVAAAPVQQRTLSSSSVSSAPMEVDLTKESIKDKVSSSAKSFEKLFYAYGDQLTQATQEVLAKAKGVDAQSAKEISGFWSKVRKQVQPKLNQRLMDLVQSVPDELELEAVKEMAHPGVRPVAFRDLVENARADIVQSLEELVPWVVTNAQDPATLQSLAGLKQEAHTQVYDTVLSKMSRNILDRMADVGSVQVDFGRDSDYGQALQAHQNLAKEKDDLELQLEGYSNAQAALLASKDKVDILGAETKFLGTDDANVDDSATIKVLEAQLRAAEDANVNLQRIVADQQKQISPGSGGAQKSLVERAREIGFVLDPSGNLQLGPPPRQVFDISKPYSYTSRKTKWACRNSHRYGPCGEDTKVDMLGEYLAGEAKRVYRSILSSWDGRSRITFDELESRMKNLMLDNSRTGMLLKQQRVHGLRMKEDESYPSFITFLETKVCEAYDDESYSIVDGVKIQVLLKNIRDPTLALQVEQALRNVPMGSPLFPTAKDLVIAYERTAKQACQWNTNAGSGSNRQNGKGSGRGRFQGTSASQEKSEVKSSGTDVGASSPTGGNSGGVPSGSVPVCFNCHKPGHRRAVCRSGGAPQLTGGNAAPAKFGNRGPIICMRSAGSYSTKLSQTKSWTLYAHQRYSTVWKRFGCG